MFASKTIAAHLVRGVIAAALSAGAVLHQSSNPAFAVAAGVMAVVAMRGCPLCWTMGLVETSSEEREAFIPRLAGDAGSRAVWLACLSPELAGFPPSRGGKARPPARQR